MINYEEARKIVEKEINTINSSKNGIKVALIEDYFAQTPFLWMFFFQSEEFLQTWNMNAMLGGNAPFLIAKLDGNITQYSTSYSEEQMIELYEEENNIWQLVLADESYKDLYKLSRMRKVLGWTMQELNERRKQDNTVISSGGQQKLLSIQRLLQVNGIQSEMQLSEKYKSLLKPDE